MIFSFSIRFFSFLIGRISPWDLLICLSSRKNDGTGCIQIEDLHRLELFQKVQDYCVILCGNERTGLSQIFSTHS